MESNLITISSVLLPSPNGDYFIYLLNLHQDNYIPTTNEYITFVKGCCNTVVSTNDISIPSKIINKLYYKDNHFFNIKDKKIYRVIQQMLVYLTKS